MVEKLKEIIKYTKLFLFDLDGTLYLGDSLFPFTKELLSEIKRQNKRYIFITNNSSKNPKDYVKKFEQLGIKTEENEFITSGRVTLQYMTENYKDKKIYLCGTKSLRDEFIEGGLTVTDDTDEAEAVVVGCDTELDFKKLDDVCRILYTKKIPYIATHPDMSCPTEYGKMPDCGAIADMIFIATGKMPVFIGKPSPLMPELAMYLTKTEHEETVVIGDRLSTDIKSGTAAMTKTIFVLSGDDKKEDLKRTEVTPTVTIDDCGVLLSALKKLRGE